MKIELHRRGSKIRFLGEDLEPDAVVLVREDNGTDLADGEERAPGRKPLIQSRQDCEPGKGGLRAVVFGEDPANPHVLEVSIERKSFRTIKPIYGKGGQLLRMDSPVFGLLEEGKHVFRHSFERCRHTLVPAKHLVQAANERVKRERAEKQVEARNSAFERFLPHVKSGMWSHREDRFKVLIREEMISFPDRSLITLPAEGEESCQIVAPPYGVEDCLACHWAGWNPAQELTPENGPPWMVSQLARALQILQSIPEEQVSLLPERGDRSPILRLGDSREGFRVFRTVTLEKIGL